MAVQACPQCSSWVSSFDYLFQFCCLKVFIILYLLYNEWYVDMLLHLGWLLSMLILLKYCSLASPPSLVLPLRDLIYSLCGCGWQWESWRLLRLTVDTTSLGVLRTFYLCMEGKFQPTFFVFMENACVALLISWYLIGSFNRAEFHDTLLVLLIGLSFMISIIVCFIPSPGIMHQHLPTWTGEDLVSVKFICYTI